MRNGRQRVSRFFEKTQNQTRDPRTLQPQKTIRYNKRAYKGRNVVERSHNRLKDFRRIATRYDRLAITFFSAVGLAATFAYWL